MEAQQPIPTIQTDFEGPLEILMVIRCIRPSHTITMALKQSNGAAVRGFWLMRSRLEVPGRLQQVYIHFLYFVSYLYFCNKVVYSFPDKAECRLRKGLCPPPPGNQTVTCR